MKKILSKKEAQEKIENFFSQKKFDQTDIKKIKKLAMKYKIRLKGYRKKFCKSCYSNLEGCKTRIGKSFKTVECKNCDSINRWKI